MRISDNVRTIGVAGLCDSAGATYVTIMLAVFFTSVLKRKTAVAGDIKTYVLMKEQMCAGRTVRCKKMVSRHAYSINGIDFYGVLNDNSFNILKDNLENKYNEEEYIKSISKLYIIDLYSLKNKLNKYDINVDFIYPDIVSNYRLNIENTLYKYLENNSDGNRNQELPVVSNVIIDEILDEKYSLNNENVPCKKVKVTIEYENDLGYDKSGTITLVKQDKYYYIVEYN